MKKSVSNDILSNTPLNLARWVKISVERLEYFFLENRLRRFMQIVSKLEDNLQEMSKSIFWETREKITLSSVEIYQDNGY